MTVDVKRRSEPTRPQTSRPVQRATSRAGAASTPAVATLFGNLDYPLLAILATFLTLGLFLVYSASAPSAGPHFFLQQLKWVAVGMVALMAFAAIPYRFWQQMALPLMAVTVLGLLAVLILGERQFGAIRTFAGGRFQPSEIAKLAIAIYVAAWVAARGKKLERFEDGLAPFLIIMGLVAGLIALERSFSVTMIVLTIGLAIFFVGGGNVRQVLLIAAIAAPVLLFAMWQAEYPFKRINDWLAVLFNPAQAPREQLYIFEMLRSGSGTGTDPSVWRVKEVVPGLWSDYLFANLGADLHFPGTFLVVALYAWFGYRSLGIALNARDRFGGLLAVGITAWVLIQAAIHIGTSLALIPVTGQPLPFMSYGGSSLVSCMAAAGILLSISRASTEKKDVYAHFAFGWRDRRPRVSRAGRGRRPAEDERPIRRTSRLGARPAARRGTIRRRASDHSSPQPGRTRAPSRTDTRR